MHKKNDEQPPNPRDTASLLSRMTFWWIIPMMRLGYKRPIEAEDIYKIQQEDDSKLLGELLNKNWEKEQLNFKLKGAKPSFFRAIFRTFGFRFCCLGTLGMFEECIIRIAQPVCLGLLIQHFSKEGPKDSIGQAWLYASVIVIAAFLYQFTHHPYFFGIQKIGMKIRVSSCGLVFQKALRLSKAATGQTTVGQMVNLLSNDVNRFDTSILFLHYLWIGPLQTIIVTYIMWQHIGPSCLAGIIILILFIPLQTYMGKIFSKLRLKTAVRTDERVRLMNEIMNSMNVIKMYAWEIPFTKMLEYARKKEIDVIMHTNYFRAVNMSLFFVSSKLIIFLSLLTYVLTGNILDAEKVFVTTALINNIRISMTLFFPFAISMGSETLISCKRIQDFLEMEEVEECNRIDYSSVRPEPENCKLELKNVSAKWKFSNENVLKNLSFKLQPGEILNVIGAIGCGKSSLLNAILGELPIHNGQIKVDGKISYAAQEPWLFGGTLRDNILLGNAFVHKKYNDVIRVCSLQRDIEILPDGDRTMVGERGVSLSGGQKARISLARAVYVDADIYLLDDPLSAVDAHVGKKLYEDCIMNYLKSKIRILITHQIQYLTAAKKILILNNGSEEASGSYLDLTERGIDFSNIADAEEQEKTLPFSEKRPSLKEAQLISRVTRLRRDSEAWVRRRGSRLSLNDVGRDSPNLLSISAADLGSTTSIEQEFEDMSEDEDEKKEEKEFKKAGSISSKVYLGYFSAGGTCFMNLLLLITALLTQALFSGSDYWLSFWTNQEQRTNSLRVDDEYTIVSYNDSDNLNLTGTLYEANEITFKRETYVYVYSGMTIALFIFSMARTIWFFIVCMTASKNLHNRMLFSLLRAPIKFFDSHPIGQILNRFTKDMGQVDELLPQTFYDFSTILMMFMSILIVVATVNFWIVLPTLCLAIIFVFLRRFYICSARDIKRLEGITRSPVFSHLSTTLHGLTTIRAFGAQEKFIVIFDDHQNLHSSTWFLFLSSTRWFGLCLDLLTSIYLAIVTFSFMDSNALGGDVGLAISSAMMLSGMFQWGVRQSAEVENQMTSVERVIEYSELEPEEKKDKTLEIPKEEWPDEGRIVFKEVSLRYNEYDPAVLKRLHFVIKPGRKIGIVGRTGAGKSSLITCIFRMTEPEGIIEIDNVIINNIPLSTLRSSISIIPQSPTLFSGTLRYNLDPFGKYKDDEIWSVLAEVQLTSIATDSGKGLEATISEGGGNLSVGQRQLLCLARAILKKSKILVMDEATANVDQKTDALIQTTIREKFKECTVLTVAHRLNTIIDCDRAMVMSAGRLMEYDEPYLLLQNKSSLFYSLVMETGFANANYLHDLAKNAFHKRHSEMKVTQDSLQPTENVSSTPKIELSDEVQTKL